jgi:two-component system, OmpR family, response regulator ChvI
LSKQYDNNNNNTTSITNSVVVKVARKKRKLLVVDDEQDIITSFKLGLEESGLFEVDAFTDPHLALSNLEKIGLSYYDLLLIDIKMSHMSGFELYQEIKKRAARKETMAKGREGEEGDIGSSNIKVCFITAYEIYYDTLKNEFPTLNVGCFIKKPIGIQDLINRLKQELQLQ